MTKRKEYRPMTVGLEMASDRKSWESWNFQENLKKMESIIASDDFQALDDEVKADLLKYVTWDLYKNNKTEKVDNLGEICPWWNITPLNKSRMQYYITMGKNLFKMASSKK